MLHAHRVDQIDPAKGSVEAPSDPTDVLSSPQAMSYQRLTEERERLKAEMVAWSAERAVAARQKDDRRVRAIGQTIQMLQTRSAAINVEIKTRNVKIHCSEDAILIGLLRDRVSAELFLECQEIARKEARAQA